MKRVRAAYWPRAETVFWSLIETPERDARAAFAAEAAAVLREAARPAISQHFRAAPAIAAAVATLRRRPAAVRRRAH